MKVTKFSFNFDMIQIIYDDVNYQNEMNGPVRKISKKDHIDLKMLQVSLDFIDSLTFICCNQKNFHNKANTRNVPSDCCHFVMYDMVQL